MRYLPHTPAEIAAMLAAIGLDSEDDLFRSIPDDARPAGPPDIGPALDETTLSGHLQELAGRNRGAAMLSFLGAGNYDHIIPHAVDQLLLRSELYTAYTPYQPEVAQGTLQLIFEFQTIVSELLGLPVANASMYDGSTATAEAVLMARRLTRRDRTIVSGCVHPEYIATVCTYLHALDADRYAETGVPTLTKVEATDDGAADVDALARAIDDETACVVVGYPSFFGTVSELSKLAQAAHDHGALLVTVTCEPYALAVVEPPGAIGADVAVAEGQALGPPPQYGGPGVGLFACRGDRKFVQQMPGRLCGETVDSQGKRGYVLTLATREQHIRRERATSNICTNSGLCAAAVTIKMSLLGKRGFVEAATQCLAKAEYLAGRLASLEGYRLVSRAPTFNELCLGVRGNATELCAALVDRGIIAGLDLGRYDPSRSDQLLVAVTEKHTRADLDRLVDALESYRPAA
ncbi:MAG: aminomethyl-transferring glycine dehydrogenase subunit GcvPA [Deltaproteobacteria bacterium]|jgi:glycine dehydrogenase subunit 1|nr:aminomethyl-transferring glycine dehydrogenase subunit GcvPA [Deltaproteobacteria bacterium]MBW2536524.1 aminomethyl-transferring glycine dehydrogenase subunit GcvPA [Deltaproteobacteria bacterium]